MAVMNKEVVIKAISRDLKVSPYKLNQVARLIRPLSLEEALMQLKFCNKRIAGDVEKCLKSAIANAEHNFQVLDIADLVIKKVLVSQGRRTMKRMLLRAKGRPNTIKKASSSLEIALALKE